MRKLNLEFANDNKQLGKVLFALAHSQTIVEFSIKHTVKDVDAIKNELLRKAVGDSKIKEKHFGPYALSF